jgi:hypothetical protein
MVSHVVDSENGDRSLIVFLFLKAASHPAQTPEAEI